MTKGIRIFIVEDEIITAASMEMVLQNAGYAVVGMADEAEAALLEIERLRPDFVLLDVHLSGQKDGIWLADRINHTLNIPFVFVTAQGDRDTIKAATQTRPYGYLIKPFMDEDIFQCIETGLANFSDNLRSEGPASTSQVERESHFIKDALFIKNGNLFLKVLLHDILFFQSDKNYVDVYTLGKKYASRNTLKEIAQNLSSEKFIQVNRSVIINVDKIDAIGTYSVHIKEHEITLSENYKDELLKRVRFLGH